MDHPKLSRGDAVPQSQQLLLDAPLIARLQCSPNRSSDHRVVSAVCPASRAVGLRTTHVLLAAVAVLVACSTPATPATREAPVVKVIENSLGMRLVLVPAGEFLMGSDESPDALAPDYPAYERKRFVELSDEAPVHAVRITRPFYLGQHEVTVGQFRRFLSASGYTPESEADGTGGYGYNPAHDPSTTDRGDAFQGRDPRYSWRDPGFPQGDDHPVLNVTWNDAVAMSAWLSKQEGKSYRLPTEAEWEYACRAGTRTRYYSGDDPHSLLKVANTFDAEAVRNWPRWQAYALEGSDGFAFTAPVGSFEPNALGLHDMLGNAWEWVADWHDENYYATSPVVDPPGPEDGMVHVRRGGSWHTWALYARCGYRNWNSARTRYTLLGVRLLREVDVADLATPASHGSLGLPPPSDERSRSLQTIRDEASGRSRRR